MNESPTVWFNTKLEDVLLSIVGGGTPSKSVPSYFEGNIPWMTVKDMNKNILEDTVDHISQEAVDNSSTNVIPAGTPIVATRMSLGKIVVARFDSAINQDLKALFHSVHINKDYLVYWYRSNARLVEELGTGTTVKGIRLEVLKALNFPLAPLTEQKVSADKLDKLLAKVDSIKARLDAVPYTLKRFRQSLLAAAVSGKLTEEWREENVITDTSWSLKTIGDLCEKVVVGYVGSIKSHISTEQEVPLLSTTHIQQEGFTWKERRFVTKSFSDKTPKSLVVPDDILVARHGDSGRCCIVPDDYPEYQTSNVVIIKTNEKSNARYIALAMNALKDVIKEQQVGGVMKVVNTKSVAAHQIPAPSKEEQEEVVRRVEKLFAYADKVEAEVNAAQERVNKLTQSILAKAFRGELTAKWREQNPDLISGDNSAEALLAKIKTEREKLKPAKKTKKKGSNR